MTPPMERTSHLNTLTLPPIKIRLNLSNTMNTTIWKSEHLVKWLGCSPCKHKVMGLIPMWLGILHHHYCLLLAMPNSPLILLPFYKSVSCLLINLTSIHDDIHAWYSMGSSYIWIYIFLLQVICTIPNKITCSMGEVLVIPKDGYIDNIVIHNKWVKTGNFWIIFIIKYIFLVSLLTNTNDHSKASYWTLPQCMNDGPG